MRAFAVAIRVRRIGDKRGLGYPVPCHIQGMADQCCFKLRLRGIEPQRQGILQERQGAIHNVKSPCGYIRKILFKMIGLLQDMGLEFVSQARQLQFHAASPRNFTKSRGDQPNLSRFVGDRIKVHHPAAGFRSRRQLGSHFKVRHRVTSGPHAPEGNLQFGGAKSEYLMQLFAGMPFERHTDHAAQGAVERPAL